MIEWVKEEKRHSQDGNSDTTQEIPRNPEVVFQDRRIPGEVASDLSTRKAQAFKTENSEVIFRGLVFYSSCMTSACLTGTHTLLPFSQSGHTPSPFRLRDFRLPYLGRPEAMAQG